MSDVWLEYFASLSEWLKPFELVCLISGVEDIRLTYLGT